MKRRYRLFAAGWIATVSMSCLDVRAECAASERIYAEAAKAIEQWQAQRRTGVLLDAKDKMLDEFCAAAARVVASGRAPEEKVRAATAPSIADYLERTMDSERRMRTLEAGLLSQLGAGGLSRPALKPYGRLRIAYNHQVSHVVINSFKMPQYEEYIVAPGTIALDGFLNTVSVCHAVIQVLPLQVAQTAC